MTESQPVKPLTVSLTKTGEATPILGHPFDVGYRLLSLSLVPLRGGGFSNVAGSATGS